MAQPKWSIRGTHMVNCNCDYGCPCQFVALPTDGTCRAVVAWQIDEGYYDDVRLDGLIAVATYGWPGAVHEGDGEMQIIVDERADEAQRKALAAIMVGEGAEPGMTMLQIYAAMCPTKHDTIVKPIELTVDMEARTGALKIPGLVKTTVEPLKNPVTGAEHRARIDLPMGKEFHLGEVASGTTTATGAVALEFTDSHAHFVSNAMTSEGPMP